VRGLQALVEWAAGLLLFALVCVGFLNVLGRYTVFVFMPWTEEIARLLFVWVVWLGAAAGMFRGGHVRFDFVVNRLPPRLRRPCEIAVHAGVAAFLLVILRYGYQVAQSQAGSTFLTVDMSVKYTYLSSVVGSAMMLVALVGGLWTRLTAPADAGRGPS
jgi:TRAP-type C4-dicarboxylate transport system permease small subunit